MSYWTYISGVVEVNVYCDTQPECRYVIETVLDHLPYVTGSERNMNVHVVQHSGHNSISSHNEFGESMCKRPIRNDGDSFYWDTLQVCSEYSLLIEGKFRDRMLEDTVKEFSKWLTRLSKRLSVSDIVVKIKGQNKTFIISDPTPYSEMYESFAEDSPELSNWGNYMAWERVPGSFMPLQLYAKYYRDEEIDAELKRREEWRRKLEAELDK